MQSENSKITLAIIITALIVGGGMYFWHTQNSKPSVVTNTIVTEQGAAEKITQYYCEHTGGTFANNSCVCPLENNQTQADMYDTATGQCQTTAGGSGGEIGANIGIGSQNCAALKNAFTQNCLEK